MEQIEDVIQIPKDGDRGECGHGVTWTYEAGVLTITGNGDIDDDAFCNWETLTEVVISEGNQIENVGKRAFKIGKRAFKNCRSLTKIVLPDDHILIESEAFAGCESLTEVDWDVDHDWALLLPDIRFEDIDFKNIYIRERAFADCKNLTKVDWGEGHCYIDRTAFEDCPVIDPIREKELARLGLVEEAEKTEEKIKKRIKEEAEARQREIEERQRMEEMKKEQSFVRRLKGFFHRRKE